MKVQAISSYLLVDSHVLHLLPEYRNGASFGSISDVNSVVLNIHEDEFRRDLLGLPLLMNYPIEVGVFEKHNNIIPMVKIGPDENPYIYTVPMNPADPSNQGVIDLWAESRFIVVCFLEGVKDISFKGIRVLGISDLIRDYIVDKWIMAIQRGFNYSIKYLNFMNGINALGLSAEELWSRAVKLGELEE